MELSKDFRRSALGVIPSKWEVAQLGEICVKIQDGTHFSPTLGGNDYLYVTSKNIRPGRLDLSTAERISADEHRKIYGRCDTRRGDILLTKDGANTGNAALNTLDEEVSLLSSVAFLRFNDLSHDPRFFLQQLLADSGQARMREMMSGNAITRLTLEKIRAFDVVVPPLAEQQAIADALSDADALVESLDALIAKKCDMKQAMMQQLLTCRTRLHGFSGEWRTMKLGDLGEISGAGVDKKIQAGELPVRLVNYLDVYRKSRLSSSDFTQWVSARPDQVKHCEVRQGDVLFTPTSEVPGDICRSAVAIEDIPDGVYSYHLVRLRIQHNWDLLFRAHAFASKDFMDQAAQAAEGSGTRYVVTLRRFRAMSIRFPIDPLEQGAIGEVLSNMDAETDALVAQREKAELVKQGMMQELLSGRVRLV